MAPRSPARSEGWAQTTLRTPQTPDIPPDDIPSGTAMQPMPETTVPASKGASP